MADDFEAARVARGEAPDPPPDPHGLAALLLVESLAHVLVARSVLTLEDAIEAGEVAFAVSNELAAEGVAPAVKSMRLLAKIVASWEIDNGLQSS